MFKYELLQRLSGSRKLHADPHISLFRWLKNECPSLPSPGRSLCQCFQLSYTFCLQICQIFGGLYPFLLCDTYIIRHF